MTTVLTLIFVGLVIALIGVTSRELLIWFRDALTLGLTRRPSSNVIPLRQPPHDAVKDRA
jgi:hypothetical protein